jgi:hypothetical protein
MLETTGKDLSMRCFSSLRALLLMDAVSCTGLGAVLLVASSTIGQWTDLPPGLLRGAGLALVLIAVFMTLVARAKAVPRDGAALVVAGNLLWAAASVLLPLIGVVSPNALGSVVLLGQAGFVTFLAWLEARALPPAVPA